MHQQLVTLPTTRAPARLPHRDDALGRELAHRLRSRIRGEARMDAGSLGAYAHDASAYHQVPVAVVVPRDDDDVEAAVLTCRELDIPLLSRGGGTSLAGQCCNQAVVLDFSKYMRGVLEIDPEQRRARVQPGAVLDDLNAAAAPYDLVFGPDPSTHNHCTLGGMIGNNACGVHAIQAEFYGPGPRTQDSVVELDVLTYDGTRLSVGATSDERLEARIRGGGRPGRIYQLLRDLRDRYEDEIRARFPDIPRRVSGYSLPALLADNEFNVAQALTGSESTCVTILEATVELTPQLPGRALLVLGYSSVYDAGDHVPLIRELRPVGCEGMDDLLVQFAKKKKLHSEYLDLLPGGEAWLFVEIGGEDDAAAEASARAVLRRLKAARAMVDWNLITDREQQGHLWEIRKAALGATAYVPGERDTHPGWEDSAVPVDRVGDYLRALKGLYAQYGYRASVYGHFGQGCVHTRIDFDFTTDEGLKKYRDFTMEAAHLVTSLGGSLSGEHGDGQSRGELLEVMFGPTLIEAFREFKRIWDPMGRMNPGKVVDADRRDVYLRLGRGYEPAPVAAHFAYPEDGGSFDHAARRCVGVGECRKTDSGTMCPSYMVTREEIHSTRGRARLLYEMLHGDVREEGFRSEAVKEALDLCLSCKGCKNECPVNVDMATYKAEFLSHYYEGRLRPRHAYAFGLIHRWAQIGALVPDLANFVTQTPVLRDLAKLAADVAPERTIPRFAPETFRRWFGRNRPRTNGAAWPKVILWADTFNNHFFPGTLIAGADVLAAAGAHVTTPRQHLCCGRPLYDYGMLDTAKRLWKRTLDALEPDIRSGTPVVGLEPSCVAAFRDELPNILPHDERAHRLSAQTFTLAEYLTQRLEGYEPPRFEGRAVVQGHCHQKAVVGMSAEEELARRMGLDARVLDSGCCGMAGAFGFERDHYDVSVAAGERVLLPAVRGATEDTVVMADGFSCREQILQQTDRRPLHLAEVMQLALGRDRVRAISGQRAEEQQRTLAPKLEPMPRWPLVAAGASAIALGVGLWAWRNRR